MKGFEGGFFKNFNINCVQLFVIFLIDISQDFYLFLLDYVVIGIGGPFFEGKDRVKWAFFSDILNIIFGIQEKLIELFITEIKFLGIKAYLKVQFLFD